MNPSGENQPLQFEIPPNQEGEEQQHDRSMEKSPASETAVGKATPQALTNPLPPPLPVIPDVPAVDNPAAPAKDDDADTKHLPEASHGDVIEKQWVEKAKAVVAQNQADPYKQKSEMGKVKAEYIKKRFNKTIPTDDTVAA